MCPSVGTPEVTCDCAPPVQRRRAAAHAYRGARPGIPDRRVIQSTLGPGRSPGRTPPTRLPRTDHAMPRPTPAQFAYGSVTVVCLDSRHAAALPGSIGSGSRPDRGGRARARRAGGPHGASAPPPSAVRVRTRVRRHGARPRRPRRAPPRVCTPGTTWPPRTARPCGRSAPHAAWRSPRCVPDRLTASLTAPPSSHRAAAPASRTPRRQNVNRRRRPRSSPPCRAGTAGRACPRCRTAR